MSDQADALRQLVRKTVEAHPSLAPGVPLVVLSGGKHGVGTSTVAWQLSQELARLGKSTVLVDANPLNPRLSRNVNTSYSGTLAEVLSGTKSIGEVLLPVSERFQFLPGRFEEQAAPELNRMAVIRFLTQVRSIHEHADVVLLEAGEGMSPWVQWLWKAAQQIYLVTKPDAAAVKDSYATLKMAPWGDVDGKISLIVNDVSDSNQAGQIGQNFSATCRQFLGMNVNPHAIIAHAEDIESTGDSLLAEENCRAFTQSVRLLAAELTSSCLLVSHRMPRGAAPQFTNGRGMESGELLHFSK